MLTAGELLLFYGSICGYSSVAALYLVVHGCLYKILCQATVAQLSLSLSLSLSSLVWQIWGVRQRSPWASCSGQGYLLWHLYSCCWLWMSPVTLSTNAGLSCASVANQAQEPKDTTWKRAKQHSCECQGQQ